MQAAGESYWGEEAESSYNRPMHPDPKDDSADRVRSRLALRLKETNRSMRGVSIAIGQGESYIFDFLRKYRPLHLPEDVRGRLATELALSEEDLGARRAIRLARPLPQQMDAKYIAKWMLLTVSGLAGDEFAAQKAPVINQQALIIADMISAAAKRATDDQRAHHLARSVRSSLEDIFERPDAPIVDRTALDAAARLLPEFLRAIGS